MGLPEWRGGYPKLAGLNNVLRNPTGLIYKVTVDYDLDTAPEAQFMGPATHDKFLLETGSTLPLEEQDVSLTVSSAVLYTVAV